MAPCSGESCYYGYETVLNADAGGIYGAYRVFIEIISFMIFILGVGMNTLVLTLLISIFPNLDSFDGFLMNLSFCELVSSFGISFLFFVQFTTSMAPIGDHGCQFIQWLNVTSVTLTTTSLLLATYDLYTKIYYGNMSKSMSRTKQLILIGLAWFLASLPGIPYIVTGEMGENNLCITSHWSRDAEVFYISVLFVVQLLLPVAILSFLFGRIFLALRIPHEGDQTLVDDTATPGTEASFQRAAFRRKAVMIFVISIVFYLIMLVFTIIGLSLALNIDNIYANKPKYARIREANSLFECLKCVIVPTLFFRYYDKLRQQFRKLCCCFRSTNQELYNSLNLRYNVYQQTVHDQQGNDQPVTNSNRNSMINDEIYETERDDVAILDNAT